MGFVVITTAFVGVVHLLVHFLLSRALSPAMSNLPWLVLILNIASIVALGVAFSHEGHRLQGVLVRGVTIWLMFQILLSVLLIFFLLGRFLYGQMMSVPVDVSMRRFAKALIAVPCVAAGATLYGSFVEKDSLVVRNYDVPIQGLGKKLQGYRIAQLSDIHLGPFYDLEAWQNLLEKTVAEKPDLLVITGDLFDNQRTTIQAAKILDSYAAKFPQGIYYCRGNHEHFRGIPLIEFALANTQIHNMVNDHELVVDDERPLYIAGVDYPMDREQFDFLQENYTARALKNIPENAVKILLAHHPIFFDTAVKYNTELVLSGHTHGGQLGLFGIPLVPPLFTYMRGWYRQAESALYVHCGNGSWFPLRLGCPPEIAIFTLQAKQ